MARRSSRRVKVLSNKPSEAEESSQKVAGQSKKRSKSTDANKIVKRRKSVASTSNESSDGAEESSSQNEQMNDLYCWKCHKEGINVKCSKCPRSFHSKCLKKSTAMTEDNVCACCQDEAKEPDEEEDMDGEQLSNLLCCIIKNAYLTKGLSDHLSTWEPAPNNKLVHIVDYRYIMDRAKNAEGDLKYKSHKQLLNDVMWMLHNTMIMYSDSRSYVNSAKNLVESFTSEVDMLLNCRICYMRENDETEPFFFYKPCDNPHPLVWAKIRFHPFWPAMAYRVVNKKVCVRFFGTYQVSYVPMSDCYFLSEKYPGPEKKGDRLLRAFTELEACTSTFDTLYGSYPFQPNKEPYDHRKAMNIMKSLTKQPTVVITDNLTLHSSKITGIQEQVDESLNNPSTSISDVDIVEEDIEDRDIKSKDFNHCPSFSGVPPIISSVVTATDMSSNMRPEEMLLTPVNVISPSTSTYRNDSDFGEEIVHLSEDVVSSTQDSSKNSASSSTQFNPDEDDDVIIIEPDDFYVEAFHPDHLRKSTEYATMMRYVKQDKREAMKVTKYLRQASTKLMLPLFNIIFPFVQAAKNMPNNGIQELKNTNVNLERRLTLFQKKLKNADRAVKYMAVSKENENEKFQGEIEANRRSIDELKAALEQAKVENDILIKERELSDNVYEQQIRKLKEDKDADWCNECKFERSQFLCCNNGVKLYKFCSVACANRSKHVCNKEKSSSLPMLGMSEGSSGVSSVVQRIEYVSCRTTQVLTSQTSSNSHMDHLPHQDNMNAVGNNF